MQDDLGGLAAFLAVAETRSFRRAGEQLGVTASAVSQTVRQLETRLNLQLFARTTRSVALTEAGEQLFGGIRPAFADVRAALESLHALRARPAGTLRLNVSSVAESFLSTNLLAEFLAEYPDVKLDVAVDDSNTDIVREGFDAGVQLGEVVAQDMVAIPVSPQQRQIVVGSPAYFAAHGKPKHPRDLHTHACIGWRVYTTPAPYQWEFVDGGKEFSVALDARVNTNEMGLMLRLALSGVGLTIGLEDTFRPYIDRGELTITLEKFCPPFPGFFLYYPSRAQTPPKLKALVDFLRERTRPRRRR
ncbi:Transcriptional regulator, LysR family [Labilithrix luteola]|uniref:Transcriptional regulator, LysR family n=1 Tax=Labilithrix luteola TaxID=1391654 RepID=A0A0K1PYZ9_9BACT|nr:LysR family transcriptional regulator [Labilithrix luteola]AKU98384.1 Transcriptional regulator, LysR family [Labilithrix luteola]